MRPEERKAKRKWIFPPRKWRQCVSALLLPLAALPALASDYAAEVRKHAEQEIIRHAKSRGWVNFSYELTPWVPGNIDSQPACLQQVEVLPARENGRLWGRVPYLVRCANPVWEIRARADVSLTVPIATARRNITKGETLSHRTLVLAKRDLANVHEDFVTDLQLLSGMQARRALRSGQVVTLNQAAAPVMVERGSHVLIRVKAGEVEASMTGEALQDGRKGDPIRVRNHSSGKTITGWVAEKGIVETRF